MVMTLHKVRETIINDQKNPNPLPYEREFEENEKRKKAGEE